MPVTLARIDQKLIHGQVTVAWVPHLQIDEIIVVDDELRNDDFTQVIMCSGVPARVKKTTFAAAAELQDLLKARQNSPEKLLILFRNVESAVGAIKNHGLKLESLNLGNQTYMPTTQCQALSKSFFANSDDLLHLSSLAEGGLRLFLQSIPAEYPVPFKPPKIT
ncbi:MAG: PTS sugar transporter subunit IIB [Deltaproteobacteria bacterium]|jgi:PTS system mannose-specific IIB component|nr:PTS sugar transporter subunit IIB [Deltaproteobacteria bacterium]